MACSEKQLLLSNLTLTTKQHPSFSNPKWDLRVFCFSPKCFSCEVLYVKKHPLSSGHNTSKHFTESHNGWDWKGPLEVIWPSRVPAWISRATSRQLWKIPRETPQSLGILCQHSITHTAQKSFWWSEGTCCAHGLWFWHWALLSRAWFPSLGTLPSGNYGYWGDSPEPPLLQSQFSQPFLIGEVVHSHDHLGGHLLDFFQISVVLGSPELDTVLQIWPHHCWGEGKDQFFFHASNKFLMQPRIPLPFFLARKLLAHDQLSVHQVPQVIFCRAPFQLGIPTLYWHLKLFTSKCRT